MESYQIFTNSAPVTCRRPIYMSNATAIPVKNQINICSSSNIKFYYSFYMECHSDASTAGVYVEQFILSFKVICVSAVMWVYTRLTIFIANVVAASQPFGQFESMYSLAMSPMYNLGDLDLVTCRVTKLDMFLIHPEQDLGRCRSSINYE